MLGQMVNDYIERISGANIAVAADYLCVLQKPTGTPGSVDQLERDRFLTKLLFNAHEKQLDQLLGAQDGSSAGYLRKIIPDNADVQRIISSAARNAEEEQFGEGDQFVLEGEIVRPCIALGEFTARSSDRSSCRQYPSGAPA